MICCVVGCVGTVTCWSTMDNVSLNLCPACGKRAHELGHEVRVHERIDTSKGGAA